MKLLTFFFSMTNFSIGIIYNGANMAEELCTVQLKEGYIMPHRHITEFICEVWFPMIKDVLPEQVDVMGVLNEIGDIVGPGNTVELDINLAVYGMSGFGRSSTIKEECDTDITLIFINKKGIFEFDEENSTIIEVHDFLFK